MVFLQLQLIGSHDSLRSSVFILKEKFLAPAVGEKSLEMWTNKAASQENKQKDPNIFVTLFLSQSLVLGGLDWIFFKYLGLGPIQGTEALEGFVPKGKDFRKFEATENWGLEGKLALIVQPPLLLLHYSYSCNLKLCCFTYLSTCIFLQTYGATHVCKYL